MFTTPMQFGPISRMPEAGRASSSSCWSAVPTGPVSANPDEITTSPRTPLLPHVARHGDHGSAGTRDERHVDLAGNIQHAGVRGDALHDRGIGVDGVDHAGERRREQVVEEASADRIGVAGGADHRDRRRSEGSARTAFARRDPFAALERLQRLLGERGRELHVDGPGRDPQMHGEAAARKTSIMRWFSGSTCAWNVDMPASPAASARCATRIVPSPWPWSCRRCSRSPRRGGSPPPDVLGAADHVAAFARGEGQQREVILVVDVRRPSRDLAHVHGDAAEPQVADLVGESDQVVLDPYAVVGTRRRMRTVAPSRRTTSTARCTG